MNNNVITADQNSELHQFPLAYEVIPDHTPERRSKKQRQRHSK